MAPAATLQLTSDAVRWSNNIVAQRFSTAVPRERLAYKCHNGIYQTEFGSLYAMCKTHYPIGGSFPRGTGVYC